jgi:hypothetical protein
MISRPFRRAEEPDLVILSETSVVSAVEGPLEAMPSFDCGAARLRSG